MKHTAWLMAFILILSGFWVSAQSASPSTTQSKAPATYSGSLHLVSTDAGSTDSVVLKWHPDYRQNADGKTAVRISKVHYASISSSGRANNVLECGATMGVEILLDGSSSSKLSVLKEAFPKGEFAFVVDNQVIAILDFTNGISKYNVVIPVTSELQAQQIEQLVKRNNGR